MADGPVQVEGDIHVQLQAPTFDCGRDSMLQMMDSLFQEGYSVTLTGGPRLVEKETRRRGLMQ
jgi:hypothetical protein